MSKTSKLNIDNTPETDEEMEKMIDKASKTSKSKPVVEEREPRFCECECGGFVVGKKARFKVGHDAKLKGELLRLAREGDAQAVERLQKLGWSHFLVDTKATRRQAAKAMQAAEKAEAAKAA